MSATALEIPKDRWLTFCNDLSKQCYGWGVTIEALLGTLGDQPAANGPPLQGISFEAKGGSAAGDLLIEVGDLGTPYEVHHVNRPRVLRMADLVPGAEIDVEIESEDGTGTVVHLRRRPELPGQPAAQAQGATRPRQGTKQRDR